LILSGARVYYAMAQDNLFFKSQETASHVSNADARAHRAGDLDLRAVPVGHVQPAAQLVIFAAVVFYAVTAVGLSGCGSGVPTSRAGARAGYRGCPASTSYSPA